MFIHELPSELTDTLILTANPYQADYLQHYYAQLFLTKGQRHWPELEIHALTTWLRLQWQRLSELNIESFPYDKRQRHPCDQGKFQRET